MISQLFSYMISTYRMFILFSQKSIFLNKIHKKSSKYNCLLVIK